MSPLPLAADADNPLSGMFYGTAHIVSPAALGTLDLSIYLDVSGTTIVRETSYIDLEKTLVFPKAGVQIGGKDVGPRVSGTLSLTAFNLVTDVFPSLIGDKSVNRRITLTGLSVTNAGNSLSGTYRETINGMGPTAVVVTGTFLLVKPMVTAESEIKDTSGDGCLDIEEIKAGGKDATVIEYSDVSYAMHRYNNPSMSPKICSDAVMKDILNAYYGTLK